MRPYPQGREGFRAASGSVLEARIVVNAETAQMLGLFIPPQLLARADEVIE